MTASELATLVHGTLSGPDRTFTGVAPLDKAGPDHATFASKSSAETRAGVILASVPVAGCTTVVVADPKLAFILLLQHLFPEVHPAGVQPGAHVHPTAKLGARVCVYPGAYVGEDAEIGEDTVIFPNATVLARSVVGRRCVLGPGAVVGHAGFALHPTDQGLLPVPQVGRVVLEDDVALGANTCVDRAFLEETRLGAGTRIDNLVQVGHNCQVGRNVVMAAQAGLSGSVTLEDGVVMAGQAGIADHVRVGAGAQVGAQAGVHRDLEGGKRWLGSPAVPVLEAARFFAASKVLPELVRRVRRLEKVVEAWGTGSPVD